MYRLASRLLRVALVVLLLGTLLAQAIVPVAASQVAGVHPEVANLVVPYSVAGILGIVCIQVALFALWRLLVLVDGAEVFTSRALRWIDVMTGCAGAATVLSAGVLVHMLAAVPGGGGPAIYYVGGCVTAGLASVLLLVVVRGVLTSAIAERTGVGHLA